MTDATTEFFEQLGERGHEPLLEKATGTVRFDLANGKRRDRWLVTVNKGDIDVSRRNATADCVVRTDRSVFNDIVSGRQNAMAAVLRGVVATDGDRELLVLFQRLLPGPARRRS